MREQVITPRAGRSNVAGKGRAGEVVQRPTRRGRGSSAARGKSGAHSVRAYLPLVGKLVLAVLVIALVFVGYRAAASASFFQARSIDVSGATHASADEIRKIVLRHVAQTGVWRADLNAISKELKNVAWVREAVVSRVLPDGLRVRVTEREQRAIVRTAGGKFLWVDDEGVSLGAASPTDQIFMRGWDESASEAARAVNRERVQKFLVMTRDWETRGISRRVSEVNLNDLNDVHAQLAGDDALIEIQLGREDFGNRLKFALDELDKERNTPIGPYILHINVAQGIEQGKHVTIGVSPDAPNLGGASSNSSGPNIESAKVNTREIAKPVTKPAAESRKAKEKEKPARTDDEPAPKKDQSNKAQKDKGTDTKEKPAPAATTESRPRRVG